MSQSSQEEEEFSKWPIGLSGFYLFVWKTRVAVKSQRRLPRCMEQTRLKPTARAPAHPGNAIISMMELGYDLGRHSSKTLSETPDIEFDFVVTMGCGDECPFVRNKEREDWNIPDPKDMEPDEFRAVRDLIEAKVKNLIAKFSVP